MLSFEFGADEPIPLRPAPADENVSTRLPIEPDSIESVGPRDDADDCGNSVLGDDAEAPRMASFKFNEAVENDVNILRQVPIGEFPNVASVQPANATILQTDSAPGEHAPDAVVEELVWDRYVAIDAGIEPTDAPQVESRGATSNRNESILNESDTNTASKVRASDSVGATSGNGSEIESPQWIDDSKSHLGNGANADAIGNGVSNEGVPEIWSSETIASSHADEYGADAELRFRSVCDRLDQLLRRGADDTLEERNRFVSEAEDLESRPRLHDDHEEGCEECRSTHVTEERLAADVCDIVDELRSELGRDHDAVDLSYHKLNDSLKSLHEIPGGDSAGGIKSSTGGIKTEGADVSSSECCWSHDSASTHECGSTMESNSTHESGSPLVPSRAEQTTSRPYRNLFTQLRRKQRGLS
jgi:hypothetical protein